MSINKYINWAEIWDKEVDLTTCENPEIIDIIKSFSQEKEMELMRDECYITAMGNIIFFFGESGGQNESDTQGWSRDYTFTLDPDFMIIDAEYSQG
jgi:hypothetical protein